MTSAPVMAAEKLDFTSSIPESSRLNIDRYAKAAPEMEGGPMVIAPADLNGDNLPEFIVRDASCDDARSFCVYRIIAENGTEIIILGDIVAHNLLLGNDYTAGVRSLLAFENSANDYEYTVYRWEPLQTRYIMAK